MSGFSNAAQRLAQNIAIAATGGLLLLAVGTVADVLLRYVFKRPIPGFLDVVSLSGAVLLAACMPHLIASRGHIAIDFLGRAWGPKAHRALDNFGALLTFLFFTVMAWQYLAFALEMKDTGEKMAILRWPVWPWWASVAAFIVLTAVVGLLTLLRAKEQP